MNLYIRYFDDEAVVSNIDDAFAFISTFRNFQMTPQFMEDFRQYVESSMPYPKRYKVQTRLYFIVIKTTANSLEEFKANGKNKELETATAQPEFKHSHNDRFSIANPGWYEASMKFKRVVVNEAGKCDYIDTDFTARVKAYSPQDCYDRIIEFLRSRDDLDQRSQYPSVKGKNFTYTFLGMKPLRELPI